MAISLKRIVVGNNGIVSIGGVALVVVATSAVVEFVAFCSLLLIKSFFVCSSMSSIFVSSSSSGIVPQSLSRVPIHWGGFPIGTFVMDIAIGAHLVELYVEFLPGKLAQGHVLNYHTKISSIRILLLSNLCCLALYSSLRLNKIPIVLL